MNAIFCILATLLSVPAAFEYRESAPASLFPFHVAAVDPAQPSCLSNAAYLPLLRGASLDLSGCNPHGIEGLAATGVRGGIAFPRGGAQLYWSRFGLGEDRYQEHRAGVLAGYSPVSMLSLGVGLRYSHLSINANPVRLRCNLIDAGVALRFAPLPWLEFAGCLDEIASLFLPRQRRMLSPSWSAGSAVTPVRGLALRWNISGEDAEYVNTISLTAHVLPWLAIKLGYASECETAALAVTAAFGHVSASYGLRYHLKLGATHAVGLTLSTGSLEFESLVYVPARRRVKAPAGVAERKREDAGRMTKKGKRIWREAPPPSPLDERGSALFRVLLDRGLAAYSALTIAQAARGHDDKKLEALIRALPGLTDRKKKEVAALCARYRS